MPNQALMANAKVLVCLVAKDAQAADFTVISSPRTFQIAVHLERELSRLQPQILKRHLELYSH